MLALCEYDKRCFKNIVEQYAITGQLFVVKGDAVKFGIEIHKFPVAFIAYLKLLPDIEEEQCIAVGFIFHKIRNDRTAATGKKYNITVRRLVAGKRQPVGSIGRPDRNVTYFPVSK